MTPDSLPSLFAFAFASETMSVELRADIPAAQRNWRSATLERGAQRSATVMATRSRIATPANRRPGPKAKHSRHRAPRAGDSSATVVGVRISHPDRVIYPDLEMSKIEFARYFERIA